MLERDYERLYKCDIVLVAVDGTVIACSSK